MSGETEQSIVFFGHSPPDTHWMQFHRDIASEFGRRGWKVVWVSPPGVSMNLRWWAASQRDRARSFATGGWRSIRKPPRELFARVHKHFAFFMRGELKRREWSWDFRPWGVTLFKHPGFRPLDALAVHQMRLALRHLGMSEPCVMLYTPEELPFARHLPHGMSAYWVGDEAMSKLDSYPGLRALLSYVDRILAISPVTFEQASDLFPKKVHRTGTGVTLSRLDAAGATVPRELTAMPGPVVGYAGSLVALRFDVALFCATADAIPEATFVLVGPGDPLVTDEIRRRAHANVLILGPRPYEALGSYIGAFDVGIVPYKLNDFNLGSDPLKVYEYLALGKPVVSVPLPSVAELGDVVSIARGPEGFAAGIREALTQDDPELPRRRRKVAESHSVERIVDQLEAWLEQTEDRSEG